MSYLLLSTTSSQIATLLSGGIDGIGAAVSALKLRCGNGYGSVALVGTGSFGSGMHWRDLSIFGDQFPLEYQLMDGDRGSEAKPGKAGGTDTELLYRC